MDRNIVYPASIPLDTDILNLNRSTMLGLGYLMQAVLGTGIVVDGLVCSPTAPASMTVTIGPGSITQLAVVDPNSYGSLSADSSDPLVKMGINISPVSLPPLTAPGTSGQAINYLIEALFEESDTSPLVLPYYNSINPSQPYSGPENAGTPQNTQRIQRVALQWKQGVPATAGSQITPAADLNWTGLYVITVSYGQSAITGANISSLPTAPFLRFKLPALGPGFGSGVQAYTASGTFQAPAGVTQIEVEVWGGGAGSFASTTSIASGGGGGGGYARKRISGLIPGQAIPFIVGSGGVGGTLAGGSATSGQASSFGTFVSATGGTVNLYATASNPQLGGGFGSGQGGDVNLSGSAGQSGVAGVGGMGGAAPMGGMQNSGTTGNPGTSPGGGASGAGNGSSGSTAYGGGAGASGLIVVRW